LRPIAIQVPSVLYRQVLPEMQTSGTHESSNEPHISAGRDLAALYSLLP